MATKYYLIKLKEFFNHKELCRELRWSLVTINTCKNIETRPNNSSLLRNWFYIVFGGSNIK